MDEKFIQEVMALKVAENNLGGFLGSLLRFGRIVEIVCEVMDAPNITNQQIIILEEINQLAKANDKFLQIVREQLVLMCEAIRELTHDIPQADMQRLKNLANAMKNTCAN